MLGLLGRARGLGVALVALALTTGAVLAGGGPPSDPGYGRQTAEQASGQIVPVIAEEEGDEEAAPAAEEETEEPEADEEVEAALVETEGWDTHGDLVSEAAQMETPEAFDGNHGAFVSCVARMNHGQLGDELDAVLAELVLADLTPDDCDGEDGDATEAEADAEAESTSAGPGRSGEAKAAKANRGQRGNGNGRDR